METVLTGFVRALRASGIPVSSTEAITAARATESVGYGSRALLRDTLTCALAKSEEEITTLHTLFDLYFAPPASMANDAADQSSAQQGQQAGDNSAPASEHANADNSPADASMTEASNQVAQLVSMSRGGEPAQWARRVQQSGANVGVENIRFASQRAYFARRILQDMGVESLEAELQRQLADGSEDAAEEANQLIEARSRLQSMTREFVDRQFDLYGRAATEEFLDDVVANRQIDELDSRDLARMKSLVRRMAKRLAARHSRRRRPRQRGLIDVPRTLRRNAGHGGVPFDLVLRRKRLDRPKVVVVCDVSGSVSRYVRFLLMFLFSLNETIRDLRAFAFSSQLHEVSAWFDQLGFEPAMNRIIRQVGSGSTDYGQALLDLRTEFDDCIDRRTTVIVLGDGRTNYADPQLEIVSDIAQRAKRLVWLCPEDSRRWGSGDSVMHRYARYCHVVAHCATLADLEAAVEQVLRAYD